MREIDLTVDSQKIRCQEGIPLLEAIRKAGIYIPTLCHYPGLPIIPHKEPEKNIYRGQQRIEGEEPYKEFEGCGLCAVEIQDKGIFLACRLVTAENMCVFTNTGQIRLLRQDRLSKILTGHPHECLICDQGEGCSPFQADCPRGVKISDRCCSNYGTCELEAIVRYVGLGKCIGRRASQDVQVLSDNPFFERNYNLCIGCLRCVNVCRTVVGAQAVDFVIKEGKVVVGTIAPSLFESGCRLCGCCVAVCPTGALSERENARAPTVESVSPPCEARCPLNIDVPRYVHYISEGKFQKALDVIWEKTPFPGVLGRICPHPCEDRCRRGLLDEPVAICDLKRFAADRGKKELPLKGPEITKKVAIIGAGPAGLVAAYNLSLKGYKAVIYESLPEPGGMLRYGIPEYRLPREILSREIHFIEDLGVEIKTGLEIGKDIIFEDIISQYDAVFIAIGARGTKRLCIENEDARGVIGGVPFLQAIKGAFNKEVLNNLAIAGSVVCVIGGGNVAVDAARSARRLGAKSVSILYRRDRKDLPASIEEIEDAEREGVHFNTLVIPKRIIAEKGRTVGIECVRASLGSVDDSGRRRPEEIEGSEFNVPSDIIVTAIGQTVDNGFLGGQQNIEFLENGLIKADNVTLGTTKPGVYAGGDAVTGPAYAVDAMAAGTKAADSIDKYLRNTTITEEKCVNVDMPQTGLGQQKKLRAGHRRQAQILPVNDRIENFKEIAMGLQEQQAMDESERCLWCNLKFQIPAVTLPPKEWMIFDKEAVMALSDTEGVCQLLDSEKKVIYIMGTENIRSELEELLELDHPLMDRVRYFMYEETSLFTTRQNEMLQIYLQKHGSFPEGNEEF